MLSCTNCLYAWLTQIDLILWKIPQNFLNFKEDFNIACKMAEEKWRKKELIVLFCKRRHLIIHVCKNVNTFKQTDSSCLKHISNVLRR